MSIFEVNDSGSSLPPKKQEDQKKVEFSGGAGVIVADPWSLGAINFGKAELFHVGVQG